MPDYKETKVDIGPESSFSKFPAPVDIGQWSYFLAKGKKGYRLLSNVCPHQMGEVLDWGGVFMCPDHGWRFEHTEGVCVNGPNSKMVSFPVTVENGRLIAAVPED
jgi:nitrite reductase/ring-hydroxylating ferredoxin subunit